MFRRRIALIFLCSLVAGGAAFGFSKLQEEKYSASASLLFRNPGFAEDLFGSAATLPSTDPAREAATNRKLVGLQVVAVRASRELPSLSWEEVSDMIEVSSEGEADVVSVTATSSDPEEAQEVANTFAREFIEFRAETDREKLLEAKKLAEAEYERLTAAEQRAARGQALSRGAEKLGILASLQTGNAELVQPAERPTQPSSPKPVRNGILGAILGLLLGVGLAFLFERLNRRIRDPEEANEAFGLPVLGTIPESKAIMESNQGTLAVKLPFAENEAFRMLRASLRYFSVDRELQTLLVTSYVAGVGKSTVSWNLARVAATSVRAIVVETDLRNPHMARQHGLKTGPGLAEVLTHQVGLDEAIQSKPLASAGTNGAVEGGGTLDVITAGSLPPNPAELLESKAMSELVAQLRERYELVVLDTAPVGIIADAFPLLQQCDGVVVVARMGVTTRDSAEKLREQLDRAGAPVLGVVANAIKAKRGRKYGYGYYGGYYGQAEAEARSAEEARGSGPGGSAGSGAGAGTASKAG